MNELENLLNSLIKMGWKPFGMKIHVEYIDRIIVEGPTMHIIFKGDGEYIEGLRALVSQESQLWQFCLENKLIYRNLDLRTNGGSGQEFDWYDYEYRLIESALVPEEELGKFLVDNIKILGNSK